MVYATLDDHALTSPISDLSIEVSECSPGSSAYCNQKKKHCDYKLLVCYVYGRTKSIGCSVVELGVRGES